MEMEASLRRTYRADPGKNAFFWSIERQTVPHSRGGLCQVTFCEQSFNFNIVLSRSRTDNDSMKSTHLLLVMALLARPGLSQTTKSDSQTQQQILDELRAIHRDMRASTTLQLLLAELQIAQTSVDRATQRRDTLKAKVTQLQVDKTSIQTEVARFESGMGKVANPDKQFVDRLEEMKDQQRKITTQEEATSEQLQDAEGRLRTAQAEQENVQSQLSDLVKKLGAIN